MSDSPIIVRGARFHVDRHPGDPAAPTLLFVHAFGGSSRAWQATVDALGGAAPAVALDLRGWGASEATETGYAVADMAADVGAVVTALGLERWALVGHSMGGKAALALASQNPAGLVSLVLVAPSPPTPEPLDDAERERLRAAWPNAEAAEETLARITVRPLLRLVRAQAVADAVRASRAAWMAWLDTGSLEDLAPLAARITVPTLVVAGADDAALGADVQARETVARIAGARLETVERAGHGIPLDAPGELAALIRSHVFQT